MTVLLYAFRPATSLPRHVDSSHDWLRTCSCTGRDSGAFGRADYQEEEVDTMSEPNGFRPKRNEHSGGRSTELISASNVCGAEVLCVIADDRARTGFLPRLLWALCMVILPAAAAALTGCAGMDSAKSLAVPMQITTTALPAATVQSNYLATLAGRRGT